MTRSQFLGVILSPVLLLFRRKEDEPNPVLKNYEFKGINHFEGQYRTCPDCGRQVERGLLSWIRHNEEFHTTHLQWDGSEVTAPEHLNIHMSAKDIKKLQADLKKPWWEQLS